MKNTAKRSAPKKTPGPPVAKGRDWKVFFDEWVKRRPHNTGMVDFPLWGVYAMAAATVEYADEHRDPPRGLIWM